MIELQPFNVYMALAIVALFSGFGTALGQYIFQEIVKPRLHKPIKKFRGLSNKIITKIRKR